MISNIKVASLVVGALAAVAGAQTPDLSRFPDCAQWCINSMQQANKSQELGCGANDAACACRNANFLYGVRDCSAQLCGSLETAGQAIGYTQDFCRNQGVDLASVTSGVPSQITNTNLPTGAGSGSATATGTGSATGSDSPSGTGAASGSAISTSAIVTTITEGDSTVVSTIGSSTIFAGGAGGSGTAGASGSAATSTVPIVSTVTSGDSTYATTVGSSTLTTQVSPTGSASGTGAEGGANGGTTGGNGGATGGNGGNGGATTGSGGAATTSSSGNYAPQMTAAPMGMLAAAGVAAFLL